MLISEYPKSEILFQVREIQDPGLTIAGIVTNRWYVSDTTNLLDLADALAERPEIPAVGLVDSSMKTTGIIVRREIFEILGRPFGRDVMRKEFVSRAAINPPRFYYDTSIFTVAETLHPEADANNLRYFPIHSETGEYLGLFSSHELLVALSEMAKQQMISNRSIMPRISRDNVRFASGTLQVAAVCRRSKSVAKSIILNPEHEPGKLQVSLFEIYGEHLDTAMAASVLYSASSSGDPRRGVGHTVRTFNRTLQTMFRGSTVATGTVIELNADESSILVADMGHRQGYLFKQGNLLRMRTPDTNIELGTQPELQPIISKYSLEPGDLVIVAGAGLLNQGDSLGAVFGLRGVKQSLTRSANLDSADAIAEAMLADVEEFRRDKPLHSDLAFILVRCM